MSFLDPNAVLISGVEQDAEEPALDRVYIGPRWNWRYVLVAHGTVALGPGHNFTTLAPGAPVYEDAAAREEARRG